MGRRENIIDAISRIHAAGADTDKWPDALSVLTTLFGGQGASLEFMERPSLRHTGMHSYGLPSVDAYMEHYAPMSPRYPHLARGRAGSVHYDALYYDDDVMDTHPFYTEFLAAFDLRYFLGGAIEKSPRELVAVAIQISPRQGHPTPANIRLMGALLPHIQQASDVMRRLGHRSNAQAGLESTLDWLADGVLMLAPDVSVLYANAAARAIFRAADGIALHRGTLQFISRDAMAKLGLALKAIDRLRISDIADAAQSDFLVGRPSNAPAYAVSVRPLLAQAGEPSQAVTLIFIHDPLTRKQTRVEFLGNMLKLTTAEANTANALCSGLSPDEYAHQCNISANTVYTHIRHLKEKTGSRRMAELIRKLNDVQVAVIAKRENDI